MTWRKKTWRIEPSPPRALGISVTSFLAKLDPTICNVTHGKICLSVTHALGFLLSILWCPVRKSSIQAKDMRPVFESVDAIFKFQVPRSVKWKKKSDWKCGKRSKVPLSFESEIEFFWERIFRYLLLLMSRWCDCGWDQKYATHLKNKAHCLFLFPLDWLIDWAGDWDDEVLIAGLSARAILKVYF